MTNKKEQMAKKMVKSFASMSDEEKHAHVNSGTGRRLTPEEIAFKTKNWSKAVPGHDYSMKAQAGRHEENRKFQRETGRAWND